MDLQSLKHLAEILYGGSDRRGVTVSVEVRGGPILWTANVNTNDYGDGWDETVIHFETSTVADESEAVRLVREFLVARARKVLAELPAAIRGMEGSE